MGLGVQDQRELELISTSNRLAKVNKRLATVDLPPFYTPSFPQRFSPLMPFIHRHDYTRPSRASFAYLVTYYILHFVTFSLALWTFGIYIFYLHVKVFYGSRQLPKCQASIYEVIHYG